MPKFQRCPADVDKLAMELLLAYESHGPTLNAKITFDFMFAYADTDDDGKPLGDALTKNGVKALGLARKIPFKDRALGRSDAEIAIDGDWWLTAGDAERKALLDHELYHIMPKIDKRGLVTDDLGRPVIVLRKHDYEFGWFRAIADRHGIASQEQLQAKRMLAVDGQFLWPDICKPQLGQGSSVTPRPLPKKTQPRASA